MALAETPNRSASLGPEPAAWIAFATGLCFMMLISLEPIVPFVKMIPPLIVPRLRIMMKAWKPNFYLLAG